MVQHTHSTDLRLSGVCLPLLGGLEISNRPEEGIPCVLLYLFPHEDRYKKDKLFVIWP